MSEQMNNSLVQRDGASVPISKKLGQKPRPSVPNNEQAGSEQMKRRDFFKVGLAVTAVSMGGAAALSTLSACGDGTLVAADLEFEPAAAGLTASHWAMVIDIKRVNDAANFDKIISACHKNHNVPQINDPKIEVKWIWQDDFEHTFADLDSQHLAHEIKESALPVLCNHCENPACVRVCPTQATFKQPDGIVNMDYHRCIGCRFCMTGCPYGSRSLNYVDPRPYIDDINPDFPTRTKGVVEKCNFCVERLAVGQLPYCVEASDGAIMFGDLDDPSSEVCKALAGHLSLRRIAHLGTGPSVYYLLSDGSGGDENA